MLFLDHFSNDVLIPVGRDSISDHLKRFTERHPGVLSVRDMGVKWIKSRMLFVFESYKWRWVVIWLPPEFDLVFTVSSRCLMFAEAFQWTIVSFINFPRLVDRNFILLVHLFQNVVEGLVSSVKHWRECNIKSVTVFLEELSSLSCLLDAYIVERYVDPTAEPSGFIPNRLAMSHENHFVCPVWFSLNEWVIVLPCSQWFWFSSGIHINVISDINHVNRIGFSEQSSFFIHVSMAALSVLEEFPQVVLYIGLTTIVFRHSSIFILIE